jgi:hypothetical protein
VPRLLAIAIALLLPVAAGAASSNRLLRTTTSVDALAADGPVVAVGTAWARGACERVVAWNVVRARVRPLGRPAPCPQTSTGRAITETAVAGPRIAWVNDGGGNQHESRLFVASLVAPGTAKLLASGTRDVDSGEGTSVGNLQGDGTHIVFNTWSVDATGRVFDSKLWRIEGTRTRKLLVSASDELAVLAVAGGRILLQRGDGSLEVRRADGSLLRAFPQTGEVLAATLGPADLVVYTREGVAGRLSVYAPVNGALLRTVPIPGSWPLTAPDCSYPAGARPAACRQPVPALHFDDADPGLLVYVLNTTVHLLLLGDGRDRAIGAPGRAPVFAELEPSGLFYAFRTTTRLKGAVQFVPRAKLRLP